jgi:hypothetical protein
VFLAEGERDIVPSLSLKVPITLYATADIKYGAAILKVHTDRGQPH